MCVCVSAALVIIRIYFTCLRTDIPEFVHISRRASATAASLYISVECINVLQLSHSRCYYGSDVATITDCVRSSVNIVFDSKRSLEKSSSKNPSKSALFLWILQRIPYGRYYYNFYYCRCLYGIERKPYSIWFSFIKYGLREHVMRNQLNATNSYKLEERKSRMRRKSKIEYRVEENDLYWNEIIMVQTSLWVKICGLSY